MNGWGDKQSRFISSSGVALMPDRMPIRSRSTTVASDSSPQKRLWWMATRSDLSAVAKRCISVGLRGNSPRVADPFIGNGLAGSIVSGLFSINP